MGVSDSVQGSVLKLHQALYERSDGRVGHRMVGVPTLLLRSTGRRSGRQRCNALVYAKDGSDYVLVPSNGGADQPPGWLHNVRATPEVEIQVGRDKMSATVEVLERGEPDFDRLWQLANDNNHGRYDGYQAKTSRAIPLIVVKPL
jgi:deazaflavin-dependent oxidoreductase (nitroreductase family)